MHNHLAVGLFSDSLDAASMVIVAVRDQQSFNLAQLCAVPHDISEKLFRASSTTCIYQGGMILNSDQIDSGVLCRGEPVSANLERSRW